MPTGSSASRAGTCSSGPRASARTARARRRSPRSARSISTASLQLFIAGPRDKLFTVITTGAAGRGPRIEADLAKLAGEPDFAGKTIGDLVAAQGRATAETLAKNGCPVRTIHIERLDESEPRRAAHAFHAGDDHRRASARRRSVRPAGGRGRQGAGEAVSEGLICYHCRMIRITDRISIDDSELDGRASSARPGPAGRTSTSSRPRCNCASTCARSPSLPNDVRAPADAARRQAPHQGRRLVIIAQSHRTQERNRQDARDRLIDLIRQAAVVPVKRRPTKPTRASRETAARIKKRRAQHQGLAAERSHRSNSGGGLRPAARGAQRGRRLRRLDSEPSSESGSATHARPPAQRSHRQPHRRRRGGRAAGERGQGTGRERARRRRDQDRDRHRRRRPPPDPRHRRRRGMPRDDLALAVERHATSKLADDDLLDIQHARLPRRGAAVDRRGRAAFDHHAPQERAACLDASPSTAATSPR